METMNDVFILIQLVARVIFDLLKSDDLSVAVNSFTTRNQQQFFSGLKRYYFCNILCLSTSFVVDFQKR